MFLLDTTTVSDYIRGNKNIINRFRLTSYQLIYISSITKFEIEYGLLKKPNLKPIISHQLELLYKQVNDIEFDSECAKVAASIKHQLYSKGTPISLEDIYLGAIALYHDFTVVTSNTKHFALISGLKIVDWKRST
jgi:tRNA(fMet)-specific endonuclease VapC